MGCSWLPVLSLLCLFGALLMLFPELITGTSKDFYDVPVTDPGVQEALAFAVEQYNYGSANYFKVSRIVYLQKQKINRDDYHLTLELVKTTCKKEAGKIRKYKKIQECELLPGKQEQQNCYFIVKPGPPPNRMKLIWTACFAS